MTTNFLHGVEVVEIDTGPRPIRVARSSVIGLLGTAGMGPVNVPTLIAGSRRVATETFGTVGTIPRALDAIFDQAGAVVVVINVLDPAVHKTAVAEAPMTFPDDGATPGTIQLAHLHVRDVVVKNEAGDTTYVLDTDYTVDSALGRIVRVAAGAIADGADVRVAYAWADPSLVDLADVAGTTDAGAHLLLAAESVAKVKPRILIAPGYTHERPTGLANPVVAELVGIAERLRAVIVADGPNTTDAAAITYREDWGSPRVYVVDPWVKILDAATGAIIDDPASARVAGLIAKIDTDRGFWWSPSNNLLNGVLGTSRPVDFALGDANSRANLLNEQEVATIIHQEGYRLWGNRTCSSDPLWAFLSVRRAADIIQDSLLAAHLWAVDRGITKTYFEDVAEGVNAFLRQLTALGAIIGGRCWADPDLNTPQSIQDGKVYFDFDVTYVYPAERVTFRAHLDTDRLVELFK